MKFNFNEILEKGKGVVDKGIVETKKLQLKAEISTIKGKIGDMVVNQLREGQVSLTEELQGLYQSILDKEQAISELTITSETPKEEVVEEEEKKEE